MPESTQIRVLILEDNPADAELMVAELRRAGFALDWVRVETEDEYRERLGSGLDLILADYRLPQFDGIRALQLLRKSGLDIPFILVSGTIGEELAVYAMKEGADDYLLKDRLKRLGQAVGHSLEQKKLQQEKRRAEKALSDSEERYRSLVENVKDVIFSLSTDGTIVSLNPAFETITGWRCEDWIGRDFRGIIHPNDQPLALEFFQRVLQGEVLPIFELRLLRKTGGFVIGEFTQAPQFHEGHIIGVLGVARDVSDLKRAEEQLRVQSAALESAANSVVITDRDGTITWVNRAFCDLTGYTPDEFLGQNPRILKSGKQNQSFYEQLWQTILSGRNWHGELINRRKNGSLYVEEQNITPVRDQRGEITHFIGIKQDITARKEAEETIQRNLKQIQALREIDLAINSTLDLHTVLDTLLAKLDLFITYSAAAVRLFDKNSGELEQVAFRNLDEREWRSEANLRNFAKTVFETKAPLIVRNIEKDPRTHNPESFLKRGLRAYLGVPLMAKGETLGVLSLYTKDEHEFESQEVELLSTVAGQAAIAIYNSLLYEQTKKQALELERANKVKSEFLSVMSHELRTPLTAVVGYTGLVRDGLYGEITPQQEKALEKAMSRSYELLSMINGILQATALESREVTVIRHETNLKDFLNDMRARFDIPLEKDLEMNWEYPSDLPVIKTDTDKLRHILMNLINNAIKFTAKGTVTVSAKVIDGRPETGDGKAPSVEFKVGDTGVGIPKDKVPIIFEMFRQLDSSETRVYGGVGLGLYIVKKYTELLGGRVEVESEPGKGSTFTVRLPCED